MNRNDCDIARDLMPLSVDGVCSEGSQRFLDAHTADCQPCRNLLTRMKAETPSIQASPTDEARALKQGLRWLGRRFKALWISLAVLACAFLLLLAAAGINQIHWNWVSAVPLDMSSTTVGSTSALVYITASFPFLKQYYNGQQLLVEADSRDDNPTGQPDAVILTYTLTYYPNQVDDWLAMEPDPDFRYTFSLTDYELCRDGNHIYLVDGMEGVTIADGEHLMLINPGRPVSEIRIKAGKDIKVIYTWGDDFDIHPEETDASGLAASKIILRKDYEALQNAQ